MPATSELERRAFSTARDQDAAAVGRALLKIIGRKGRRASAIRALLLAELRSEPDLERLLDC